MKYKILSPIKINEKIVTEGYAEIPDDEVEILMGLGVIGEVEPTVSNPTKQK